LREALFFLLAGKARKKGITPRRQDAKEEKNTGKRDRVLL
jgi:hypothetical protein